MDTLFHLLTDLVQNISPFPLFSMVLKAILGSKLELYGQDSPKTQQIPFYQICDLRISRKRHFVCLYDPSDSRNITVSVFSIWRRWPRLSSHLGFKGVDGLST